jgi:alcohol dehydrogenase
MLGNLWKFARIAEVLGENVTGLSEREAAQRSIGALRALIEDLRVPRRLGEFGVEEKHIGNLAQGVMKVTRLLANNPRELRLEDAEDIYRRVL